MQPYIPYDIHLAERIAADRQVRIACEAFRERVLVIWNTIADCSAEGLVPTRVSVHPGPCAADGGSRLTSPSAGFRPPLLA